MEEIRSMISSFVNQGDANFDRGLRFMNGQRIFNGFYSNPYSIVKRIGNNNRREYENEI